MKDLTKGSVTSHILMIAIPVALSMIAQIVYQLVDLYFVTRIGVTATAGVNAAGTAMFVFNALTQVLAVATVTLVAHAMGRKDDVDANRVFNQSMVLALVCGATMVALILGLLQPYLRAIAADAATIDSGVTFMRWVLPGFALLLPLAVLSAALRGTGIVRPSIAAYGLTVVINTALAPVLIAGWGTGIPLGVRGAGLSTSISVAAGTVFLGVYFHRLQCAMAMKREHMRPSLMQWRRILGVGLPAGGEFALIFLSTAVIYYAIRDLGADVQAGFGIGSRVLQAILLPGMAIAVAVGPIAGQNFGACSHERVRDTFRKASLLTASLMLVTTAFIQWRPMAFLGLFDADSEAIAVAGEFLRIMSWTLVSQGLIFTCATMFQGLGHTLPALISSAARFAALSLPAAWFSLRSGFRIEQLWYFATASVLLQSVVSLWLLHMEFRRRLPPEALPATRLHSNA